MTIESATLADIDAIMPIFEHARLFMAENGNPQQWINGYPSRAVINEDIINGNSYICRREDGRIIATFAFIPGIDPTYQIIHQGAWLDNGAYGVIHRLASDGSQTGIGKCCIDWCFTRINNIRVDTHRDNLIMQHLLLSYGFLFCGIIYTHNGTPRQAYQLKRL